MRKVDGKAPDTKGVYAIQENNEVIYVGQASKLRRRLCQHPMTNSAFSVTYIHETEEVERLENILLKIFVPRYNADIPYDSTKEEGKIPDVVEQFIEELPLPQLKRSFWFLKQNELIEENFWKNYRDSAKTVQTFYQEATA